MVCKRCVTHTAKNWGRRQKAGGRRQKAEGNVVGSTGEAGVNDVRRRQEAEANTPHTSHLSSAKRQKAEGRRQKADYDRPAA
ncbi:MAG: hypothetical protein KME42_16815 [Tildeniella nuda ZEHNDER 1965/U140]|nr:hypothetical protein [Tildeniella nuda ZEHNDER 1965/U140]